MYPRLGCLKSTISLPFSPSEERQGRILKGVFGDFVNRRFPGNLQWFPYTPDEQNYYEIESGVAAR